jgi:UDP-N-acetylglucosamine transferase subunit ALG13
MVAHFTKHAFRLLAVVRAEHRWLKRIVTEYAIDEVYSDNRYGLHHQEIPCTIITHQLYIRGPRWSRLITGFMLKRILKRFTSILVPDFEDDRSLSGALSHDGIHDKHVRYVWPLSRFSNQTYHPTQSSFQVVALISGPEPARSMFEEQLKEILSTLDRPALLITGKPEVQQTEQMKQLSISNHLSDEKLASAMQSAQLIICRSGYSTIMDLHALKCRALLVPTPGQTEQEYLAEFHAERKNHDMVSQPLLTAELLQSYLKPLSN